MIAYADASDITIWGWKGWLIWALLTAATLLAVWRIQRVTPVQRPPHTTCTAPLCAAPAELRISVGHEYYDMCRGHGVPILTEGMTR